ncbi:MAG: flagellar hook assembly protein FlgD [Thermanaerothrix sp.]|nr:flagellar hook assembly protein FlgD [Thermanaerothrix sp.]
MADGVNGVSGSGVEVGAEKQRTTKTELGKDDFLKLLVAQLTHQDPLDPLKDKDFIAQMAQFSALEQQVNMAKGIESLAKMSMASAVNYVGRTVGYTGEDGSDAAGVVQFVEMKDGAVTLHLKDGKSIPMDKVQYVG